MNALRNMLTGLWSVIVIPFALLFLVVLYCMAWIFGGREWREFLSGRDLEHD